MRLVSRRQRQGQNRYCCRPNDALRGRAQQRTFQPSSPLEIENNEVCLLLCSNVVDRFVWQSVGKNGRDRNTAIGHERYGFIEPFFDFSPDLRCNFRCICSRFKTGECRMNQLDDVNDRQLRIQAVGKSYGEPEARFGTLR